MTATRWHKPPFKGGALGGRYRITECTLQSAVRSVEIRQWPDERSAVLVSDALETMTSVKRQPVRRRRLGWPSVACMQPPRRGPTTPFAGAAQTSPALVGSGEATRRYYPRFMLCRCRSIYVVVTSIHADVTRRPVKSFQDVSRSIVRNSAHGGWPLGRPVCCLASSSCSPVISHGSKAQGAKV